MPILPFAQLSSMQALRDKFRIQLFIPWKQLTCARFYLRLTARNGTTPSRKWILQSTQYLKTSSGHIGGSRGRSTRESSLCSKSFTRGRMLGLWCFAICFRNSPPFIPTTAVFSLLSYERSLSTGNHVLSMVSKAPLVNDLQFFIFRVHRDSLMYGLRMSFP